jgi:hypothetical protein
MPATKRKASKGLRATRQHEARLAAQYRDRLATAFHEAAHAVLHVLFDVPFESVEVFDKHAHPAPSRGPRLAGRVRCDWDNAANLATIAASPELQFQSISISMAGELAEKRHMRFVPREAGRLDRHDVTFILDTAYTYSGAQRIALRKAIRAATDAILALPEVWAAVRAVAARLCAEWTVPASADAELVCSKLEAANVLDWHRLTTEVISRASREALVS